MKGSGVWRASLTSAFLLAFPALAVADNCGGLADCYGTAIAAAKVAAAIAVAIGIWAVLPEILAAVGIGEAAEAALAAAGVAEGSEAATAAAEAAEAAEVEGQTAEAAAEIAPAGTAQSATGIYPNFNPTGCPTNCVNCAEAVDNYLAGNGFNPAGVGEPTFPDTRWPGPWDWGTSPSTIESNLLAGGDGARGIAYVRGDTAAHVFNVVNQGGTVVAIDGQVGVYGSIIDIAENAGYSGSDIIWGWVPTFP